MKRLVVFDQALMCAEPVQELEVLQTTGLLGEIFPEVQKMVGFGGDGQGHKDLWGHTKAVVSQCVAKREIRWAALFHDVGKVDTFSRAQGKVTFHGHEVLSARLFDRAARRAEFTPPFRRHVRFLVRHLGHIEGYETSWTDSAVRRLHRDTSEHFDDLLALACADITTKHDHRRKRHQQRMANLRDRALAIAAKDAIPPPLPKGLGLLVIKELDLSPGPQVGVAMARLKQAVEDGLLPAGADFQVYLDYARDNLKSLTSGS